MRKDPEEESRECSERERDKQNNKKKCEKKLGAKTHIDTQMHMHMERKEEEEKKSNEGNKGKEKEPPRKLNHRAATKKQGESRNKRDRCTYSTLI